MDVGSAVEAYSQAAKLVQPADGALDNPSRSSESTAMLRVASGNDGPDASLPEHFPVSFRIVGPVALDCVGSASRTADFAGYRRNCVKKRLELRDVMPIGAGDDGRERHAAGVDDHVVLCSGLASIGGIGAGFFPRRQQL